jgi:hypothetical protein
MTIVPCGFCPSAQPALWQNAWSVVKLHAEAGSAAAIASKPLPAIANSNRRTANLRRAFFRMVSS